MIIPIKPYKTLQNPIKPYKKITFKKDLRCSSGGAGRGAGRHAAAAGGAADDDLEPNGSATRQGEFSLGLYMMYI